MTSSGWSRFQSSGLLSAVLPHSGQNHIRFPTSPPGKEQLFVFFYDIKLCNILSDVRADFLPDFFRPVVLPDHDYIPAR